MATSLSSKRDFYQNSVSCLIFSVLCINKGIDAINIPTAYKREHLEDNDAEILSRRSSMKPPLEPQERIHPGIIAAVVFVSIIAIVAAGFIIRKYCFQRSEAIYRYSVLRRMEEVGAAENLDGDTGLGVIGEDSDEDILE
ncbi:hypothetical protein GJAV_G00193050 [Gymnothorax javanicus]|nr:hypothetical protein GJAV_G00193050 [Gymnothorax javanicus]